MTDIRFQRNVFFCSIFLICLILLTKLFLSLEPQQLPSVDGVLDLRGTETRKAGAVADSYTDIGKKSVELNGEWDFAPGILFNPSGGTPSDSVIWKTFPVPAAWSGDVDPVGTNQAHGVGTYHLKILLPQGGGMYGIKTTTIRSAFRVFANGKEVMTGGVPGLTVETTTAVNYADIGIFEVQGSVLDLTVQVANHSYPDSGIVMPIRFGLAPVIIRDRIIAVTADVLTVAVFLFCMLFFLFQFLLSKKKAGMEFAGLLFSLFVLSLAANALTHSEKLLYYLFQDIHYMDFCRMQILSAMSGIYLLYLYVIRVFPMPYNRLTLWSLNVLLAITVAVVLSTSIFLNKTITQVVEGIGYFLLAHIFMRMIRGWMRVRTGKYYIALGICASMGMCLGNLLGNRTSYMGVFAPQSLEPLFVLSQFLYIIHVQAVTKERLLDREAAFLNAQIKPHFLFNTLNTIQSLCFTDARKAELLLAELGVFLHGRMDLNTTAGLVSLEQELQTTRAYISIEMARFESKFAYAEDVGHPPMQVLLPPLTIQPLVENAFRHGLRMLSRGGIISVKVQKEGEFALVEVSDNGVGIPESIPEEIRAGKQKTTGIALNNINLRLLEQFGQGLRFDTGPDGCGTRVSFRVPLQAVVNHTEERKNPFLPARRKHAERHPG